MGWEQRRPGEPSPIQGAEGLEVQAATAAAGNAKFEQIKGDVAEAVAEAAKDVDIDAMVDRAMGEAQQREKTLAVEQRGEAAKIIDAKGIEEAHKMVDAIFAEKEGGDKNSFDKYQEGKEQQQGEVKKTV